jgi:putative intracellular protease/amidase
MASDVYWFAFDGLADWESPYALAAVTNRAGQKRPGRLRVRTVGLRHAFVTTLGGVHVQPDLTLDEMDPAACTLLILPGGNAWEEGGNTEAVDCARAVLQAGGRVAAICAATLGLARAGLLDARRHTSNAREYLAASDYQGGALYEDAPAVTDGNVITAGGVFPLEFARHIARALDLYPDDVLEAWYRLHKTGKAEYYHALMKATEARAAV